MSDIIERILRSPYVPLVELLCTLLALTHLLLGNPTAALFALLAATQLELFRHGAEMRTYPRRTDASLAAARRNFDRIAAAFEWPVRVTDADAHYPPPLTHEPRAADVELGPRSNPPVTP